MESQLSTGENVLYCIIHNKEKVYVGIFKWFIVQTEDSLTDSHREERKMHIPAYAKLLYHKNHVQRTYIASTYPIYKKAKQSTTNIFKN